MYSEKSLEELNLPVGLAVFAYGDDWKIDWANDAFCQLFRIKQEWISDQTKLERAIYYYDYALMLKTIRAVKHEHEDREIQVRLRRRYEKNPEWVNLRISYLGVENDVPKLQLVAWNINDQKNAEHELQVTRKQYEILEEVSQEISFDFDVIEWKALINARLSKMVWGKEMEDHYIPFSEALMLLHPLDRDNFSRAIHEAALDETSGSMDYRISLEPKDKNPQYVWYRFFYRSLVDEDGQINRVIGRGYNIELDRALQDEVRRDPLTQLLNKMETMKAIQRVLKEHKEGKHVLFLIDIDNFKGINDNFGHTFGDTVICDVATAIRKQFRGDDIVGRVGGDEFIVLMRDSTKEIAKEKARSLCTQVRHEYTGSNTTQVVSISVGLAFYGEDGENFKELYDKADHAMYHVKKGGKNGFALSTRKERRTANATTMEFDEAKAEIGAEDREFLTSGYNLLTHARDLDGSLNMLLSRIRTHYDLDAIQVCERNDKGELVLTNCEGRDVRAYKNYIFKGDSLLPQDHEMGKIYTMRKLALINLEEGKSEPKEVFEERLTASGAFLFDGDKEGQISFLAKEDRETFTGSELRAFEELLRTVGIFVALRLSARRNKKEIQQLQNTDQLTGLFNFTAFKNSVQFLLKEAAPNHVYALEYLDFNNFGYVNENYGYKVGDTVLKLFAEDIADQDFYCMGCRLYSDFFVILSMDVSREALEKKISAQHKHFSEKMAAQYSCGGLAITAGVYLIEHNGIEVDQAFENANLAWRASKNNGNGILWFTADMRRKKLEDQKIVGQFYETLYRKDFVVYLQPRFELGSRRVNGAEALARWRKENGEILTPAFFLGPIEQIGYVTELDYYMFDQALQLLEKWQQEGRALIPISTNFSGKHFDGDGQDFLNRIQAIFSKYNVPASCIEIEVTESVFIRNKQLLKNCMKKLRKAGFKVAIDDFGTGYSSLSMLIDIPADEIKMDKVFVNRTNTRRGKSIVTQIGKLVETSGHDIIFEGVETEEQESFLQSQGFKYAQGFLCDQPIPVSDFEKKYLVLDFEQKTEE